MTDRSLDLSALLAHLDPALELLGSEQLAGGVSAGIFALRLGSPRGTTSAVLRLLPRGASLDADAEARLMTTLDAHGFPAPRVLGHCGPVADAPAGALLLEHAVGRTVLAPGPARVDAMAALLLRLHALPTDAFEVVRLQWDGPLRPEWDELDPRTIADLLRTARAHPPVATGPAVLCHGDFWPGNLLWREDDGVAVLDWEDAGFGDRLFDLAIARLELLWEAGAEAMERFTDAYVGARDDEEALRAPLPAWDLEVTLLRLARLPGWKLSETRTRRCFELGLDHAKRAAASLEHRGRATS